jgi:hypothetical protein
LESGFGRGGLESGMGHYSMRSASGGGRRIGMLLHDIIPITVMTGLDPVIHAFFQNIVC